MVLISKIIFLTYLSLLLLSSCDNGPQVNDVPETKNTSSSELNQIEKKDIQTFEEKLNPESKSDYSIDPHEIEKILKKYSIESTLGNVNDLIALKKLFIEFKTSKTSFEKFLSSNYNSDIGISYSLIRLSKNQVDTGLDILDSLLLEIFSKDDLKQIRSKVRFILEARLSQTQAALFKEKSAVKMKKILLAIAEYSAFHNFDLPNKLEDLKQIIGKNFDDITTCSMTGKKFMYLKAISKFNEREDHENIEILHSSVGNSMLVGYLNTDVKFFTKK